MREGRQNEGDDTGQPAGKVVRLPRDWLGPREELVPFGRQPATPAASGYPPSAADFWGESSAAIHDALQAPPPTDDPVETGPSLATGVIAPRRRGALLAAGVAMAATALAAFASAGFGLHGSPSHRAVDPKLNMAAVLSSGVSRMLQRGVAIVGASATGGHATAAARRRPRVPRRIAHPHSVLKPVHESARREPAASLRYSAPVSADLAHAAPPSAPAQSTTNRAGGATSETSITPARHVSSPSASRASKPSGATVSPTGESGALGPIQSPNG